MRTVLFCSLLAITLASALSFDPRAYPKSVAECEALNRKDGDVKKIRIHYVDLNPSAERTLIMVHGWPSLWSTWSNQIEEFKKDFRVIAVDHRGFGSSTHPDDVESSGTMGDLVGDLICVLNHARVKSAVCVGHDWGAQVCYEAARMRPDVFHAVAAAAIPYIPSAGEFVPISALLETFPRLAYQLFFQDMTQNAAAELDADIRRTLRATLRNVESPPPEAYLTSKESFLHGWHETAEIPPIPFMTLDEEDYLVEQYSIQGFRNTLQFYTHSNRHGSWEFASTQGNHTIPQPVLSILPTEDPVGDWLVALKLLGSEHFLPNLRVETLPAAHWPQLERPQEFNAMLRNWLESLGPHATGHKHVVDEL